MEEPSSITMYEVENCQLEAYHISNKKMSNNDMIWLTKFVSKFTANGRNMLRWNKWNHSKCPRCDQQDENNLHILMCEDDEARENLYEKITELDEWMEKYDTNPTIRNIFITTLFDFGRSNFDTTAQFMLFDDQSESANMIRETAFEQDEIGWMNTFEGKLSTKWEYAQDEYYTANTETRKTGLT